MLHFHSPVIRVKKSVINRKSARYNFYQIYRNLKRGIGHQNRCECEPSQHQTEWPLQIFYENFDITETIQTMKSTSFH